MFGVLKMQKITVVDQLISYHRPYYQLKNYAIIPAGFVNMYNLSRIITKDNEPHNFKQIKMMYAKNLKSALLQANAIIKNL